MPLNVEGYRRATQRRLMLAHIRDAAARLPDLAQVEWAHLDTQALHTAVSAIIRMHSALGRNVDPQALSADEALLQRQLVALHAAGSASAPKSKAAGLSAAEIDALPVGMVDEEALSSLAEHPVCVICHEGFKLGAVTCRLPGCTHTYHAQCIGEWLAIKALCPLCKSEVRPGKQA